MNFPSKNLNWLRPVVLAGILLFLFVLQAFGVTFLNTVLFTLGDFRVTVISLVVFVLAVAVLLDARK